jgi:PD-(D/E)XK nuclease superfamily
VGTEATVSTQSGEGTEDCATASLYAAQTLTYMRLTDCPVGLLINFNVPKLMNGVTRQINPHASPPNAVANGRL